MTGAVRTAPGDDFMNTPSPRGSDAAGVEPEPCRGG